jgi:hypothetical protein
MSTAAATIRRTILDFLERAEPYALPEATLKAEVRAATRPPATEADFDDALLFLGSRGYIRHLTDDMDPDDADSGKWFITESGKTLLRK